MLQIIAIINLIVAVQSLFLVLHFTFKKLGTRTISYLLAMLFLCFTLVIFNTFFSLHFSEINSTLLQDISNNTMWFIGPLFYLFVTYNEKKSISRSILVHTVPFLIPTFFDLFFQSIIYDKYIPFVGFTQMVIYLTLSIAYCTKHYKVNAQFFGWALPSIIVFTLLVVINFAIRLISSFGIELLSNELLQSFTTLLIIPIFYMAYREMNTKSNYGLVEKKYRTTPLSDEKIVIYLEKITHALEQDKMYRNNQLNLSEFAKEIDIPSKYISQVINLQLQISFSEYLVRLRLEEVKYFLLNDGKSVV